MANSPLTALRESEAHCRNETSGQLVRVVQAAISVHWFSPTLLCHCEYPRTSGCPALRGYCDVSGLRARRHGCRHFRVRIHRKAGRRYSAKRDLRGLSQADSGDHNGRSHWAAGWLEADDLRRYAEYFVAGQLAARRGYRYRASGRSTRDSGRQVRGRDDLEGRGSSIKRNALCSREPLPEDFHRQSDFAERGHESYEWFETQVQTVKNAALTWGAGTRAPGAAHLGVSVQSPTRVLEKSNQWSGTLGAVEVVKYFVSICRADLEDRSVIPGSTGAVRAVKVAVGCLH